MWTDRFRLLAPALLIGGTLSALPLTIDVAPSSRMQLTPPVRLVGRGLDAIAATGEKVILATSAASAPEIVLADKPVRVVLAGPETSSASLGNLVQNLGPGRHLHLVLNGLSAAEPPGVIYYLYLDLPPGATPAEDDPHYVGAFNFFSFVPLPDAERSAAAGSMTAYSYDVTAVARTLQRRGLLRDPLSATIVPGGRPTIGARVVIGEIALVER
jgi:hypothetical protein